MRRAQPTIRELLQEGDGIVVAMGAHDGLGARLAEREGFRALYHGSYAAASAHGVPDIGLVGLGETAANLRRVTSSCALPVIADADTGYGDEVAVAHTVRELQRAGASAIQLEDQVWPKRCGHMPGKEVVPVEEMVLKVRAAVAARDPETVVIARTDALQRHGLDDALARCNAYAEAGADLIFVDAPQDREQLVAAATRGGAPGMANMVETGVTPLLPVAELEAMGFVLVIFPATHVWAMAGAYRRVAEAIREDGTTEAVRHELLPFAETNEILGLNDLRPGAAGIAGAAAGADGADGEVVA